MAPNLTPEQWRDGYDRQWTPNEAGAVKIAEDLDRYRAIIEATEPDVIVETGTHLGASAAWFARWCDVVTIDTVEFVGMPAPGVTYVTGSSTDRLIVARVRQLVRGRRVMVVLDSDHHPDHVRAELDAYGPLVSPGCYLVVEDGHLSFYDPHKLGYSPRDALDWFGEGWEHDDELEALHPITMHPDGWWRRCAS